MNKLEELKQRRHSLLVVLERCNLAFMKLENLARYESAGIRDPWIERHAVYARASEACKRLADVAQQEADRLSQEAADCVPDDV